MAKSTWLGAVACIPVMAGTTQAQAQGDEAGQQSVGGAGDLVLPEIVVTAQRKAENLQQAAIPINAATAAELLQGGVADATALNKVAPALYVVSAGGANAGYFVRGVGNFTNNGYTAPAVAFNLDGVYIGRPSSTLASFLDVNRVEVLKGPQGTLYGRNATGGAINVIPNVPDLDGFSGNFSAAYENYDQREVSATINLPAGDRVALRLAGAANKHDGYYDDGTAAADDLALRAQLLARLSDSVNLRISGDYSTQKATGPGLQIDGVYRFTPFSPSATVPNWTFVPAPADVSADYTGLHAPQTLEFIRQNASAAPLFSPLEGYAYPFRDDSYWGINAELNVALGDVTLVVIPAHRKSTLDNQFNGPPFKGAINQDEAKQSSIEARLSGGFGALEWILGGYYFDENVRGVNSFNQFSTVTHNAFDSDTESFAVFGRGSFSVTDSLRLVGGIRYTDESRAISAAATSTAGVCLIVPAAGPRSCPQVPTIPVGLTLIDSLQAIDPALFPAGSPLNASPIVGAFPYGPFQAGPPPAVGPGALLVITPTNIDRKAGDEEITYRLAVEYDVGPSNLLYASFETGFRAGGFNVTFGREEYEPEFIDAWTLGSKNRFLGGQLQVNIEAFYWEYEGQQLAALGLDGNNNNSFFTRNVGSSSIKGVDIDFQLLATQSTLLRGGVQYLDAKYDNFRFNQVDLSAPTDPPNFLTPVTGCATTQILAPTRSFDIDCSGRRALNAPEWTANLGIEQSAPLGGLELVGTIDGRYRSDRVIGFHYLPTGNSGDSFTVDATLTLRSPDSGWSITAFGRNLTDEAVRTIYQIGAGNVTAAAYEPPRTYGLRVGFEF